MYGLAIVNLTSASVTNLLLKFMYERTPSYRMQPLVVSLIVFESVKYSTCIAIFPPVVWLFLLFYIIVMLLDSN